MWYIIISATTGFLYEITVAHWAEKAGKYTDIAIEQFKIKKRKNKQFKPNIKIERL